jgi:hypothetical protein
MNILSYALIITIICKVRTDIFDVTKADDDIVDRDSHIIMNLEVSNLSQYREKTPLYNVRFSENDVDFDRIIQRSRHPLLRDIKFDGDEETEDESDQSSTITLASKSQFVDSFRIKLSSDSAVYRAVIIQKDYQKNVSMLYINSYSPTLEKDGYSYVIVKTADQIYFTKHCFGELVKFFYSGERKLNFLYGNVEYNFIKHIEIPSYEFISLFMRITIVKNIDTKKPEKIQINRGITLNIKEFSHLLSRSFQLLKDMEFN